VAKKLRGAQRQRWKSRHVDSSDLLPIVFLGRAEESDGTEFGTVLAVLGTRVALGRAAARAFPTSLTPM
jgi:hypothetical protein